MHKGKVKFFNDTKGYGFITMDSDGQEMFFHISSVDGRDSLKEGEVVEFEVGNDPKTNKKRAENVQVL